MSGAKATSALGKPTGSRLISARWSKRLGIWSAWEQARCPHAQQDRRLISGDERNYGYLQQCMACGLFSKAPIQKGSEVRDV